MRSPISFRHACIATIAYADIFAYPLSEEELREWMIAFDARLSAVRGLPKITLGNTVFFQLHLDKIAVYKRFQRASWTKPKWAIAHAAAKLLSCIPTVQFIGVTGGVAMNNAAKDDDIDLLIITSSKTLWITRLVATLLLDTLSLRRKPKERHVQNKICLNMFMNVDNLGIPSYEQDLFAAHELLQMVPVFDRGSSYVQLLKENRWARTFLPNAFKRKYKGVRIKYKGKNIRSFILHTSTFILRLFEIPAKRFQLWYMKRHRTNEVITDVMIRFHPRDARVWIKKKLAARLRRYHIPLDRIFSAR